MFRSKNTVNRRRPRFLRVAVAFHTRDACERNDASVPNSMQRHKFYEAAKRLIKLCSESNFDNFTLVCIRQTLYLDSGGFPAKAMTSVSFQLSWHNRAHRLAWGNQGSVLVERSSLRPGRQGIVC